MLSLLNLTTSCINYDILLKQQVYFSTLRPRRFKVSFEQLCYSGKQNEKRLAFHLVEAEPFRRFNGLWGHLLENWKTAGRTS